LEQFTSCSESIQSDLEALRKLVFQKVAWLSRAGRFIRKYIDHLAHPIIISCPARERKYPRDPSEPGGGYRRPASIEMLDVDEPRIIPLHLLMLNDIALAGISAELFTEIGMRIKENSVFDRTLLVTVMSPGAGYIPTDEAYSLPAEKAVGNTLKPGCAEPALVAAFRQLMLEYVDSR